MFYQDRWTDWVPFAFYIWIAQSQSRTVVIDTGFPLGPELETLQNNVRKLGEQSTYREVVHAGAALQSVGIELEHVTDVIVTSFVLHSTGGLMSFPNAKIHLSSRGWMDYWRPELPHPFARNVFFTPDTVHWLIDRWDSVNLLDNESEPIPGIRTFWTGCHRRSSTAVSLSTELGRIVIFEPAFMFENIEQNIPIGGPEALDDWYRARDRARLEVREGGILLPQHDPALLERFPAGMIAPGESELSDTGSSMGR